MFPELTAEQIQKRYDCAKQQYKNIGVDTDAALDRLAATPISIQCWQGDDVKGFEVHEDSVSGGGIMSTGNYPGAAQDADTLRKDAEKAFSLIPGLKRFSLHAIYAETDGQVVDRDQIRPEHFARWMAWSKANHVALDFNPTFFAHPKANDGFTLSHPCEEIRRFWINHDKRCREIAEAMGRNQGSPCIVNHWIPDGAKDQPFDRWSPRRRLTQSLEDIFSVQIDPAFCRDAVESKLFGIGAEDYTVGSHEFYMGYALKNNVLCLLDTGHFHPTENVADKIPSLLLYSPRLALHVSRPVRWDSDHVLKLDDNLQEVADELVRNDALKKTYVGLDYFDGSLNRVAAIVIGSRNMYKAVLKALCTPWNLLKEAQDTYDHTKQLMLQEEIRDLPYNEVWKEYCRQQVVEEDASWYDKVAAYEENVLSKRQ